MYIPYYISQQIRSMVSSITYDTRNKIYEVLGPTLLKSLYDDEKDVEYLCGVITLKYNAREVPVILVSGQVYDVTQRIYNEPFVNFYILTGASGINIEKSKYMMSKEMLRFFIMEKIDFLPAGETFRDLNNRRVEKGSKYNIGQGWLIT